VAELDQALIRADPSDRESALRAAREGLLARMQAAVRGLEQAKAEVAALMIDTGVRSVTGEADERLAAGVASLRAGMAEVHRLASGQGLT
jgi:hypothetical protein